MEYDVETTKYDVEADWNILSTCNYRCHYCFFPTSAGAAKAAAQTTPESLAGFFDATGLTWLLHITGGEPFVYPQFVQLCQRLTERHFISVNSNLSLPSVADFAANVDPRRVRFINCSFHIEEREKRREEATFVKNVAALRDAGFEFIVTYVMCPSVFERFPEDFERYLTEGIVLVPKSLRGNFEGRHYPDSYSPDQRESFLRYSVRAEEEFSRLRSGKDVTYTVNPFLDRQFVENGLPDFRGKPCGAGHSFMCIGVNGDITRCGPLDLLGNVADGAFRRRQGPSVCDNLRCPYFCLKHVKTGPALPASTELSPYDGIDAADQSALAEQLNAWQLLAERLNQRDREKQAWIDQLEHARAELDEQRISWQEVAEERERRISELDSAVSARSNGYGSMALERTRRAGLRLLSSLRKHL